MCFHSYVLQHYWRGFSQKTEDMQKRKIDFTIDKQISGKSKIGLRYYLMRYYLMTYLSLSYYSIHAKLCTQFAISKSKTVCMCVKDWRTAFGSESHCMTIAVHCVELWCPVTRLQDQHMRQQKQPIPYTIDNWMVCRWLSTVCVLECLVCMHKIKCTVSLDFPKRRLKLHRHESLPDFQTSIKTKSSLI